MQNVEINPDSLSNTTLISTADTLSANSSVLPASNAWPGSHLAIYDVIDHSVENGIPFIDDIANLCITAIIIILFLFAFSRILEGIYAVALSVFNAKRLMAIERQTNLYGSRNILLLFSIIVSVFIFINNSTTKQLLDNNYVLGIRFLAALGIITAYFIIRYTSFKILDWVNSCSVFKYVNRFYYTHASLGILLIAPMFLISIAVPQIPSGYIIWYVTGVVILTLLLYFTRGYQIIISNGFSHFFWILYLCTLEILPSIAILHIILS